MLKISHENANELGRKLAENISAHTNSLVCNFSGKSTLVETDASNLRLG